MHNFNLMKLLIGIFSVLLCLSKAFATDVILCNGCQTPLQFQDLAKSNDLGMVYIVNLNSGQVKLFNVIQSQRDHSQLNAVPLTVPGDAILALDEYYELLNSFENYNNSLGITTENIIENESQHFLTLDIFLSNSTPNGCGSPTDPWSNAVIPNFPYRAACDSHDVCYTSGRSKASCDDEFLFNMNEIRQQMILSPSFVSPLSSSVLGIFLFNYVLDKQMSLYHQAVSTSPTALAAYCNSGSNGTSAPECIYAANNIGTGGGGTYIGSNTSRFTSHFASKVITQTCELWRFPDGNNGYYYLQLNCTFH
jgi:hypothetical protein